MSQEETEAAAEPAIELPALDADSPPIELVRDAEDGWNEASEPSEPAAPSELNPPSEAAAPSEFVAPPSLEEASPPGDSKADADLTVQEILGAVGFQEPARATAPGNTPDVLYNVNTRPPTRERLFRILSPQGYLSQLEAEYREAGSTGLFFLPSPADVFDAPDSDVLPSSWFQSRKSGRADSAPRSRLKGFTRIFDNAAQHEVGMPPEVAIHTESIGSVNMNVTIDIQLASSDSKAGVVVRAGEPKQWTEPVDQIEANTYYYAVFSGSAVSLYHHEPGKEDRLIQSASLAEKLSFNAAVTVFEKTFQIFRDGQAVLTATDDLAPAEDDTYCGFIVQSSVGGPTRLDNFIGRRYGGAFVARAYAPSSAIYRGPNVHYHPLYFEHVSLERYGQHFGNCFAPWVSHALFFADAAMLPYSLGKSAPWACHSDVCFYKPGDIVPFRLYLPVCDTKGGVLQATVMALSWSIIP